MLYGNNCIYIKNKGGSEELQPSNSDFTFRREIGNACYGLIYKHLKLYAA